MNARVAHAGLLLVGSVPLDSAQQVFGEFGQPLGRYLGSLPDGEVGFRRHWISRLHFQVLAIHPDIEVLQWPDKDDGVERLQPHSAKDSWRFRVRPGVKAIRFGEPGWRLGFARDAVNSYFVFRTLRDKGLLPAGLRFQVGLPLPHSAVPPRVVEGTDSLALIREGYEVALRDELSTICSQIPADDLAIQWDCSTEVQEAYEASIGDAIARNAAQVARLAPLVPAGVAMGFHLCFGTLGGWPRFAPDDLGRTVDLANAFIASAGRQVDWMHIPLLDRSDDAFFAPLSRLEPRGARVFLGAIHNMQGFAERVAAARRHLPDFGVAAFCGFGRMPPAELPRVLADHLDAMARMPA